MTRTARRTHRSKTLRALMLPLLVIGCMQPAGCGSLKRFMYEGFGRDDWQKPDEVVAALGLSAGDQVADLGAGGGYFTYPLAEAVGPQGRIYAVDIDESLLAYVADQATERGLSQIEVVRASETDPGLAPVSVDLVFLSNVFHHLPDRVRYFAGVRGVLRPGGRVAIVELQGGGFPPGHATAPEEIAKVMEEAGYMLLQRHGFLSKQSFQVFGPKGE